MLPALSPRDVPIPELKEMIMFRSMVPRMIRMTFRISSFFAVVLAASFVLAQAEFSGEVVDLQKPGAPTVAKLYFAKDKMRIEAQTSGPHGGGVVIMNFASQTSDILMPQQHMYMEMPVQSQGQRQVYSFFEVGDVENACGDWQKISHMQPGSCHKVGTDTVNGRSAIEYEATNSSGDVSRVWLDAKVRFPLKWQGKNSGGELRNVQAGSQPASLFEIPAGYTKMDMGAMMQQHQQQ
jgi:Domain of unknown function (DUF4412)